MANLFFSYSSYPVWLMLVLTVGAFLVSLAFGLLTIIRALSLDVSVPGWASTVVIVSLFNAMTLLSLTVLGIYLAHISPQPTRSRPTLRDPRPA